MLKKNIESTPAPSSEEEIHNQFELLKVHRQTLSIYLKQQAGFSGAHAPPHVMHGIRDARSNIKRVKETLRRWGKTVNDHPDDEEDRDDKNHSIGITRSGLISAVIILLGLILVIIFFLKSIISVASLPPPQRVTTTSINFNPAGFPVTQISSPTPVALTPALSCTVIAQNLNLRVQPEVGSAILSVLYQGDTLTPLAKNPEATWLQVEFNSAIGWVNLKFIDCANVTIEILPIKLEPSPVSTDTPQPPTHTPILPMLTSMPATSNVPLASTSLPTGTPISPTSTSLPTDTPIPPTSTSLPTDTPIPPSATLAPPSSHFDNTNTEGWSISLGNITNPGSAGSGGSAGNGYLRWTGADNDSKTSYYVAPAIYHGDWTNYSSMQFDIWSDGGRYYVEGWEFHGDIYLENGDMTAQYTLPRRPDKTWDSFSLSLSNPNGWKLGGGATTLADVLKNVTVFQIRAEYGWGADRTGLDNVALIP